MAATPSETGLDPACCPSPNASSYQEVVSREISGELFEPLRAGLSLMWRPWISGGSRNRTLWRTRQQRAACHGTAQMSISTGSIAKKTYIIKYNVMWWYDVSAKTSYFTYNIISFIVHTHAFRIWTCHIFRSQGKSMFILWHKNKCLKRRGNLKQQQYTPCVPICIVSANTKTQITCNECWQTPYNHRCWLLNFETIQNFEESFTMWRCQTKRPSILEKPFAYGFCW